MVSARHPQGGDDRGPRARPGRPCRTCPGGPWRSRCRRRRSLASTSGPLPMRLPSRIGSVILPSSMRYASVMPNTKSPVAVLTCPPPRCADVDASVGRTATISSGVVGARQQVGVGHAHHRQALVGLAPAVARAGPTFLAGAQEVVHVVAEDAVFDEDVALGRAALVVDGEAAPLLGHGPVVDEGDQRPGHPLTRRALEHRGALGRRGRPRGRGRRPRGRAPPPESGPMTTGTAPLRRRPGLELDRWPGLAARRASARPRTVSKSSQPMDRARLWEPVCMPVSPRGDCHTLNMVLDLIIPGQKPVAVGDHDAAPPVPESPGPTPALMAAAFVNGRPRQRAAAARPGAPWARLRAGRPTVLGRGATRR